MSGSVKKIRKSAGARATSLGIYGSRPCPKCGAPVVYAKKRACWVDRRYTFDEVGNTVHQPHVCGRDDDL